MTPFADRRQPPPRRSRGTRSTGGRTPFPIRRAVARRAPSGRRRTGNGRGAAARPSSGSRARAANSRSSRGARRRAPRHTSGYAAQSSATVRRASSRAAASSPRVEHAGDRAGDRLHLGRAHAARRHGRRADADAGGDHRRARVERNRVLVDGDPGGVERASRRPCRRCRSLRRRPSSGGCRCRPRRGGSRAARARPRGPARSRRPARWYATNSGVAASAKATALAAMTCSSGPPWTPGKTLRSRSFACARAAEHEAAARAAQRLVRRRRHEGRVRHRATGAGPRSPGRRCGRCRT